MTIQEIHDLFLICHNVSIDTRKIVKNAIFFAIKGENFDANTFAKEALELGAKYVIIDNPIYHIDERTILVKDSLKALQELAKFHRKYLDIPILALTGSNGKTTTKELIYEVLNQKYNTKATIGNLNNHIGVPLTLLSFTRETEIGIIEMGANHQKEIEFLCDIAQPDYGYITNFGKAHLEGFGGVEGVIKGKSEMYTYLESGSKIVFVNLDDPIQNQKTISFNRITFSQLNKEATVYIESVKANPFVEVEVENTEIKSNLIGLYNANNINTAITIGLHFGVVLSDIKNAIERYIPENNRSQILIKHTNKIILDAYNANPSSVIVALENFLQLQDESKVVILGDMYELGKDSLTEHKFIVDFLAENANFDCHFVGSDFFVNCFHKENLFFYKTFHDFSDQLSLLNFENNTILIKGSRGMSLERTLNYL
jgi:UDP-N-acetylmuramoyl-tripeptide--D-alanyl-D-alanine ligase